jgi:hypothetical protein
METFKFLYLCKLLSLHNGQRGTHKQVEKISKQFKQCPEQLVHLLKTRNIIKG